VSYGLWTPFGKFKGEEMGRMGDREIVRKAGDLFFKNKVLVQKLDFLHGAL
jgi:hypothetical protein